MVDSVWQWLDVEGYANFVPVLNIGNVGTVQAVELDDHRIFESSTSLFAFHIIVIPSKEVAHAIKLFRHTPLRVIMEVWILHEESRDCVRILLCSELIALGTTWLLLIHFSIKNPKPIHSFGSPTSLLDLDCEPIEWENLQFAP
jgi:hypothetical protein